MREIRLIFHGEDIPWPGPSWEPSVYVNAFPQTAAPGDLYINAHFPDKVLVYVFWYGAKSALPVGWREVNEWLTGGLMRLPTPVPEPLRHFLRL